MTRCKAKSPCHSQWGEGGAKLELLPRNHSLATAAADCSADTEGCDDDKDDDDDDDEEEEPEDDEEEDEAGADASTTSPS